MRFLPLLFLFGCFVETADEIDYENTRRAAITGWESQVGPVSDECYEITKDYILEEVSSIPCEEGPGELVVGCVLHGQQIIFILENRRSSEKEDTGVHEYIHVLAYCEYGDGDDDHSDPALWESAGGAGSAEVWGQADL